MRRFTVATLLLGCFLSGSVIAEKSNAQISYLPVGAVPAETMKSVEKTVEDHYARIIADFNVKDMPAATVKIWQDRGEFEASYGDDAQYVQGYVVPELWEARFFNGRPDIGLGVVHEYTHLVTLALNPSFDNNPRWLWEATAIYESGRPPVPEISSLKCFSKSSYPTIENLEQHPFNIYKVGFFLVDFIVSTWGQEKLIDLVKSNGDFQATLRMSTNDFEKMWLTFLQRKYQLKYSEESAVDC